MPVSAAGPDRCHRLAYVDHGGWLAPAHVGDPPIPARPGRGNLGDFTHKGNFWEYRRELVRGRCGPGNVRGRTGMRRDRDRAPGWQRRYATRQRVFRSFGSVSWREFRGSYRSVRRFEVIVAGHGDDRLPVPTRAHVAACTFQPVTDLSSGRRSLVASHLFSPESGTDVGHEVEMRNR